MPEYNPKTGEWDEPIQHSGYIGIRDTRIQRRRHENAWFASLTPEQREQCRKNEQEWQERMKANYVY